MSENLIFFASPDEFRAWLAKNHDKQAEIHVGYYKKGTGKPTLTWAESVDQALCYGWIDGVRKSIDDERYKIRFTPRKASSTWSAVNIRRVGELSEAGLMQPTGLKAFEQRKGEKSGIYAYEQPDEAAKLNPDEEQQFRANQRAWDYFQSEPAWYQRTAIWHVVSAKKAETRLKRLAQLIDDSEHGRTIASLRRRPKQR
ncbi:MAG: YdeI/OmpD-associated family protein [Chloroflexota bacterium]